MLPGICPSGDSGECIIEAGVPGPETLVSGLCLLVEEKEAVARRTDEIARTALNACGGKVLPQGRKVVILLYDSFYLGGILRAACIDKILDFPGNFFPVRLPDIQVHGGMGLKEHFKIIYDSLPFIAGNFGDKIIIYG